MIDPEFIVELQDHGTPLRILANRVSHNGKSLGTFMGVTRDKERIKDANGASSFYERPELFLDYCPVVEHDGKVMILPATIDRVSLSLSDDDFQRLDEVALIALKAQVTND